MPAFVADNIVADNIDADNVVADNIVVAGSIVAEHNTKVHRGYRRRGEPCGNIGLPGWPIRSTYRQQT